MGPTLATLRNSPRPSPPRSRSSPPVGGVHHGSRARSGIKRSSNACSARLPPPPFVRNERISRVRHLLRLRSLRNVQLGPVVEWLYQANGGLPCEPVNEIEVEREKDRELSGFG